MAGSALPPDIGGAPGAGAPGRIGVLGMGRSGLSAAKAIAAAGAATVCFDDAPAGRARAEAAGLTAADPADPGALEGLRLLVVSPGAPHLYPAPHPLIARALEAGIALDNDIGLYLAGLAAQSLFGPPPAVAVTGSNGKSTTTALIHHLLRAAGRKAQMGGNIGRGVFDLDPLEPGETVVLELSSYQTDLARRLPCRTAVFLNLTPDHLDRHGGLGGYFAAKRRLFEIGRPSVSVIGVDQPEGRMLAQALDPDREGARVRRISVERPLRLAGRPAVFAESGRLIEWDGAAESAEIDLAAAPALRGAHNHQNACAAFAAVRAEGLSLEAIRAGLASFAGLAHRMQRIAERGGVAFVNDSKATNAEAAEQALKAYPRVRWIAGGRAKEGGVAALRPLFGRIAKAYLIGEAAASFAETLGEAAPHEICGDMATAVARAAAEALPGEAVLLSPAAASFDQYPDFEARGRAFEAAVAALPPA